MKAADKDLEGFKSVNFAQQNVSIHFKTFCKTTHISNRAIIKILSLMMSLGVKIKPH